ncbi:CHAT domain-containing protein [Streptomyces mirabilis]|uniref:CHAT domain-containing protein n=1 Tax=Streptomyces sp. NPDC005388 TaxID=3156717 RepID=UPI0033BDADB9
MLDREAALTSLNDHLANAENDSAQILGDDARRTATALLSATNPEQDLTVAHALGWYHWRRHCARPQDSDHNDLVNAIGYLTRVYAGKSSKPIPEPLAYAVKSGFVSGSLRTYQHSLSAMHDCARDLLNAYEDLGQRHLIDQAVALFRWVLTSLPKVTAPRHVNSLTPSRTWKWPTDHPDRAHVLSNLGFALRILSERAWKPSTSEETVGVGRGAIPPVPHHPDRAMYLNALGKALRMLSERTWQTSVLEEAVAVGREAVAAAAPYDPDRAMYLNALGISLRMLSERTGKTNVLEEAVVVGREAVAAAAHRPGRAMSLRSSPQYLMTGVMFREDRDRILNDHAAYMNNLAIALRELFERTGHTSVLEEAVVVGREAADAADRTLHPGRIAYMGNLEIALQMLSERTGKTSVLEEAVVVGRNVLPPFPHPEVNLQKLVRRSVLNSLWMKFQRTGQRKMLEAVVKTGREVVKAEPDYPDRAMHVNILATALRLLFERSGEMNALEEAITVGREAVAAVHRNHPDRAAYLNNLAIALQMLSEHTGQRSALDEACSYYHEAAVSTAGALLTRITAYRHFATLCSGPDAPQAALKALEDALDLVQQLAPGHLARAARQQRVGLLSGLAGEAAAAALAAAKPERAVELLERTRGILAADTLGMRSRDAIRLRECEPDLADEFDQLRSRLDAPDHPSSAHPPHRPSAIEDPQHALDAGRQLADDRRKAHDARVRRSRRIADDRRDADDAWGRLIARVRGISGFEDFLQAPPISELARHAKEGPIVIVNTSSARCDALILTDSPVNPVQVVPLPDLTHATAFSQVDRLRAAREATTDHSLDPRARIQAQQEILIVLAWIWDSITEPILTSLGHTTTPRRGKPWPRVWWCPVGPLAFLPLHAAGHHTQDFDSSDEAPTVLDRVISSYTTTVRALTRTRTRSATTPVLVVPVADTPGARLLGVGNETTAISTLIPDACLLTNPTRETVLRALPGHRIAHFACHGHGNWIDPARSHLILADHDTAPLTMADITALDLTADLAYLSACDTSVTAPHLTDESLHITGAFYLAGYRHVIGTLWPINDRSAAEIATDFYVHLTNNGTTPPQTDRSAQALHEVTRRLRTEYPNTPTLWAAHTHTGT